ncbi:type II toxin-antitoxin system Phd/YefM family antitoxin [Amycolatopsis taiwanensis]|uniref:Antitoxin n=1 Tax=Amycolatopsis taiwanensis TaxID=342230 RepID=A0A9W6VIR1_9PSEU|nr:hypothetical protein [Amycolatopsis taiwanensis]GLY67731.1 antitoxin [Amycolatopsis taiwanensis]
MTVIPDDQRPLTEVVAEVERTHGRIDIERDGQTVASVVSPDYLESLYETIEVASDPELVAAIEEGDADIAAGRTVSLDDVKAELGLR